MNKQDTELVVRYMADELDAAEQESFCERLRSDEQFRREFVIAARREAILVELIRSSAETGEAERELQPLHFRPGLLALAAGLAIAAGVWWAVVLVGSRESGQQKPERVAQVVSGKGEKTTLKFDSEETTLEVAENTVLRLPGCEVIAGTVKSGPQKVVELVSGSVTIVVAKQGGGRTFVVRTGQANLTVVGTRFSASVIGGRTHIDVKEGGVRVNPRFGDASFILRPGMAVDVEEGKTVQLPNNSVKLARYLNMPEGMKGPTGLAYDGKLLWISAGTQIWGVDPHTTGISNATQVVQKVDLTGKAKMLKSLTWGDGCLWVCTEDGILRVRAPEGLVEKVGDPGLRGVSGLAYGDGRLWANYYEDGRRWIAEIDASSGKILGKIPAIGGVAIESCMWFDNGLWVSGIRSYYSRLSRGDGRELLRCPTVLAPGDAGRGYLIMAGGTDGQFWFIRSGGSDWYIAMIEANFVENEAAGQSANGRL